MHIDKYELNWIRLTGVMLVIFMGALVISAVFLGVQLPGISEQTTPIASASGDYDINQGWVRELAPGRYEVNMRARVWSFEPREIRIPEGSTVTFYIHSDDIVHGIKIQDTTVSTMIFPARWRKLPTPLTKPVSTRTYAMSTVAPATTS